MAAIISPTTKVIEQIPSGFSMSTISLFRSTENKHDKCRGKDCMRNFCEFFWRACNKNN